MVQHSLFDLNHYPHAGHRIKGKYLLTGLVVGKQNTGRPYWQIKLSDSTSDLVVYCRDASCFSPHLQPNQLVDVELRFEEGLNRYYYCCKFVAPSSQQSFDCLQQLPLSMCAQPQAMIELINIVYYFNSPNLKGFIETVLSPVNVGIGYITVPASLNYHHNFRSGLLLHTVEICHAFLNDKTLTRQELDLAITAAIMHDIGKTKTMTADMQRTAVGTLVDHDDLTLEICASALSKLSEIEPLLANELRHAWTCSSPNARYGFKPKTRIAKKLQNYDRFSAHAINLTN